MHRSTSVGRGLVVCLTLVLSSSAAVLAQKVERVSVNTAELQDGNSPSTGAYITPDGRYVVFQSSAELDPNDNNGFGDVYVRDRVTGKTARVSLPDPGVTGSPTDANASCSLGRAGVRYCSDDGRFVVFQSSASNLVNNDHNGEDHVDGLDVFVRDRDFDQNGIYDESGVGKTKTVRVSVSSGEGEWHEFSIGVDTYSGGCSSPSISADGEVVAFQCQGGPFNGSSKGTVGQNCYVRKRDNDNDNILDESGSQSGTDQAVTVLVSLLRSGTNTGDQFDGFSHDPAISGNGRFVAFVTASQYLDYNTALDTDNNDRDDIYVFDLNAGSDPLMRATLDSSQNDTSSNCVLPSISHNGRYIAFLTGGDYVTSGTNDTNGTSDVYVRDRGNIPSGNYNPASGTTSRVSYGTYAGIGPINAFVQLDQSVESPAISADGGSVAFVTSENGVQCGLLLPCADQNSKKDVYVRRLISGTSWAQTNTDQWTYRASRASSLGDGNGDSIFPSVADGGSTVAFASVATNLVQPDTNAALSDVYVSSQVIGSQPSIVSVVSRKWHGATAYDIELPLTANSGIEDRADGPSELVVTFSEPVHLAGGAALVAPDLILDAHVVNGDQVTFMVHGAVDEKCSWFQVGNFVDSDDNALDGLVTVYYRYLQGDYTAGTLVNASDLDPIKLLSGQNPTGLNFRADIYPDGELDAADIIRVKARLSNSVVASCN